MAASPARQALAAAARSRRGHEPWLFYPEDGQWRWWSFERGNAEIERWRAMLERGGDPAEGASGVGDAAAGGAPAPESSPSALCRHLAAWPEEAGAEGERFPFDRLLMPRPAGREIVVVTPPAEVRRRSADFLARRWLEWCCAHLAALVLEPSRRAWVGSVLWCRPTVLLTAPDQERALAAAVRERSGGRDRKAAALLDRLRVLLVSGGEQGVTAGAAAIDDAGMAARSNAVAWTGEPGGDTAAAVCWQRWGVKRRAVGGRAFK